LRLNPAARFDCDAAINLVQGETVLTNIIQKIKASNWITIFFMAAFHVGAILALFFFSWQGIALGAVLW